MSRLYIPSSVSLKYVYILYKGTWYVWRLSVPNSNRLVSTAQPAENCPGGSTGIVIKYRGQICKFGRFGPFILSKLETFTGQGRRPHPPYPCRRPWLVSVRWTMAHKGGIPTPLPDISEMNNFFKHFLLMKAEIFVESKIWRKYSLAAKGGGCRRGETFTTCSNNFKYHALLRPLARG